MSEALDNVIDLPEWFKARIAAEEEEDAADARLRTAISPRRGRILATRPEVARFSTEDRTPGGMHIPDIAIRNLREFGLRTRVLKLHPDDAADLALEGVVEGAVLIVPEYAGTPVFLGRPTPFWLIAVSDVMGVVVDEAATGAPTEEL